MRSAAIIVAVLPHGENGAVVRFLTERDGLIVGYVPGARSRFLRPVLQPGNGINAQLLARAGGSMPRADIELVRARTVLATRRSTSAATVYLTALIAATLQEDSAHPNLYGALDGVLDAMMLANDETEWWTGVVRFELLLLSELGFGLDLSRCVVTGTIGSDADLAFISPRSSQAVSRAAGALYASKLLPLPRFFVGGGNATRADVQDGFRTTGFFLERELLTGRASALRDARARMITMV